MKTTETKNKGECVCGRGSAQRKAFRKPAQVHMVTSTEVHGPHEKRPFLLPVCQGVLCIATPGNQILGRPHTAHSSGAGGSPRGMPTLCVTPPWQHSAHLEVPVHLFLSQSSLAQVGLRSWYALGPGCLLSHPDSHNWATT